MKSIFISNLTRTGMALFGRQVNLHTTPVRQLIPKFKLEPCQHKCFARKWMEKKDLAIFLNIIYVIALPFRYGACHSVIPTRLYLFTFSDIVSLIKFVIESFFSFLGYWLSCNFIYVPKIFWKTVTWEVLQHCFQHRVRRNNLLAQKYLPRLTNQHVHMIRILVISQASNVDRIYSVHSTN